MGEYEGADSDIILEVSCGMIAGDASLIVSLSKKQPPHKPP